jgi:hypothetical protein
MEKNAWDTMRRGLNEHAIEQISISRQEVGARWYRRADRPQARNEEFPLHRPSAKLGQF